MAGRSRLLSLSVEVLRWLADHQLLRPVVQASVMDEALAGISLEPEVGQQAMQHLRQQRGLDSEEALERFCREQMLSLEAVQALAERPIRLNLLCEQAFVQKAEARFLERKNSLDRVVYSLLRLKDHGLARELYLRIVDREADFAELAQQFSEGPERQTRGIVGPVPIEQAHPDLARRLRSNPPGTLLQPFKIESWWLVVRVESYAPASFDDATRDAMARELLEQWLQSEVDNRLQALQASFQS